ncbi:hypothetical protein TWF506_007391 [Arthrobotrys conoides]|uniref:Uncharacterized protein n=1 Tax=Arthrobotrys conoides TaxID=74498 RepID=A0AAN8RN80_9PEZI
MSSSPNTNKKLPPLPQIPLPTPPTPGSSSSTRTNIPNPITTTTLPFSTYPQPHFHRAWYSKCLHSTPTVRIPYGPEVEYIPSEGRYTATHKNRLCMCDSVDGYFLEEVDVLPDDSGKYYVEKEVVEEFWRYLEGQRRKEKEERKKEGIKVGKVVKDVVKGVKEVVGMSPGKRRREKEELKRKKVWRWVPRWRRLEGRCGGPECAAIGEEGVDDGGMRWRVV